MSKLGGGFVDAELYSHSRTTESVMWLAGLLFARSIGVSCSIGVNSSSGTISRDALLRFSMLVLISVGFRMSVRLGFKCVFF